MTHQMSFQLLISGSLEGLDVEDLRAHASYTGGYNKVSCICAIHCNFF